MNILITGCSWVQRMKKQKELVTDGMRFKSFGGQGLHRIEEHLDKCDTDDIDYVFLQLPTPIRSGFSMSTTEKFKEFVSVIKEVGEDVASKKWLDSYKQKIFDINKLHNNIIFFLYNEIRCIKISHSILCNLKFCYSRIPRLSSKENFICSTAIFFYYYFCCRNCLT